LQLHSEELARFKGNFSSLDTRAAGAQTLVASLDNDRQQAMIAARVMAGKTLKEIGFTKEIIPNFYSVKEAVRRHDARRCIAGGQGQHGQDE
ncbi:hypothetical protein Q6332_28755, partial [Klebsiella pneumoniae]|uniref:hypothetical protein n=1 Tax=Klebsiella pneumoniae TaxID=573 RepID=UPI00273121EF